MKTIRLAFVALLTMFACHVASAQSLVGTWECRGFDEQGDSLVTTLTFNEDGTFTRVQDQIVHNLKNEPSTTNIFEGGKWKLISGGKRIRMKIKPATVTTNADKESHGFIAKLMSFNEKVGAVTTLYLPKILSLTEDELTLLESVEDDSGPSDQTYSYTVEVTYKRIK